MSVTRVVLGLVLLAGIVVPVSAKEDPKVEHATFAAGCFWGVEKVFSKLPGVLSTRVGYTGGTKKSPTYEQVCTGMTGHAEAIDIVYDPAKISYEDLLETFFTHHDSTQVNRQGNDIGTQYRSAVFVHSPVQEKAAKSAIEAIDRAKILPARVATRIEPAGEFWPAEEYHQKYLQKNPNGYCNLLVQPKKIAEVLRGNR
jgi:peptide-methionine (S)-S-oxide reductase